MPQPGGFFRRHVRRAACRAALVGVLVAIAGVTSHPAQAQATYPTKPIRIVVGFAAGGPADIIARLVGAKLGDILGQQVYIENRTGAGGVIGTETVARAENDGYTLLMTPLANAVNETLAKNLRYKFGEHLVAVASVAETANVLVVHPSLGVKNVSELIALAKAKPGDILYASAGRGTATHLTSELFNMMAGTKLAPVHYRGGGETIKDLVSARSKSCSRASRRCWATCAMERCSGSPPPGRNAMPPCPSCRPSPNRALPGSTRACGWESWRRPVRRAPSSTGSRVPPRRRSKCPT
jgi:Tripartite tricarboxylate transporter family receptor